MRSGDTRVRMGYREPPRRKWMVLAGAVLLSVVGIVAVVVGVIDGEEAVSAAIGCADDADCGAGRSCLASGCVPMVKGEPLDVWRENIQAQRASETAWKPDRYFGERMMPVTCPAPGGEVAEPPVGRLVVSAAVQVFEIRADEIGRHHFLETTANVWVDVLRFEFGAAPAETHVVCADNSVVRVSQEATATGMRVDAALKNACPAGKSCAAGVSIITDPPKPGPEAVLTFEHTLSAAFGKDRKVRSVLAFPLGADVLGFDGASPAEQRLLSGFIAYYFDHDATARQLRVRYKMVNAKPASLDLTEVSP